MNVSRKDQGSKGEYTDYAAWLKDWLYYQSVTARGIELRPLAKRVGSSAATMSRINRGLGVPSTHIFMLACYLMRKDPCSYFVSNEPTQGSLL